MPVCPIIKTREALYSGGLSADEDDVCKCKIGGNEYVFQDAPMLVADESFEITRQHMNRKYNGHKVTVTGANDNDILGRCRVTGVLTNVINEKAISDFNITGAYESITPDEVIEKYAVGKTVIEKEKNLVRVLKSMTSSRR